jgi:hypothetical protein
MRAAVINLLGQPPAFQNFPDPVLGEGEELVKVHACGLHPIVKALARGEHYMGTGEVPFIPGVDGVGVLENGRRVYFGFIRKPWGTMAELAAAPKNMCFPIPNELDSQQEDATSRHWHLETWTQSFLLSNRRTQFARHSLRKLVQGSTWSSIIFGAGLRNYCLKRLPRGSVPNQPTKRGGLRLERAPAKRLRCLALHCAAWI